MQTVFYVFFSLTFVTLVASTEAKIAFWNAAPSPFAEEEDAIAFIKCAHKAIDGGLPSAGIPDHNPLAIRNISTSLNVVIETVNITFFNNELDDLLVYNLSNINGITYSNPERVYYTYDIYWPTLTLKGQWEVLGSNLVDIKISGNYTFDLIGVDFSGFWNMTKPNQTGYAEHLDDFQINISAEDVDAKVTGVPISGLSDFVISQALKTGLNSIPVETASEALKARFNDFWIANPAKIDAIIANCQ